MLLPTLVNRRFGIVRRVEPRPLPRSVWKGLRAFLAWAADTGALTEPIGNPLGSGCVWWDAAAAQAAAIGEALERYAATLLVPQVIGPSYRDLVLRGLPALDPTTLALYAPFQYHQPGFPFVPFTTDTPAAWVWGQDAHAGQPVLVPWSLVTLRQDPVGLPRTNFPIAAGLATATSWEAAAQAALAEVIERDAFARAWARGQGFLPLEVPSAWTPEGPQGVLTTRLLAVPNAFGLPIVLALVTDREQGLLGVGLACRSNAVLAARKALAEAAMLLATSAELADPANPVRAALVERNVLKPYRADRRYQESYAPDWHDAIDLVCHVQLTLDPTYQAAIEHHLHSSQPPLPLSALPAGGPDYGALLAQHGFRPLLVDLTPADVRLAGGVVVRAVVPGLVTTAPAAFPMLGHDHHPDAGLPPPLA